MREIKFRVWDKNDNKMYDNYYGIDTDQPYISLFGNNINEVRWNTENNIKLMQYTGLKDKNGKEIYEGDILKFYYQCSWAIEYDAVYFRNGEYRVADFRLNHVCSRSEVIGNIYEDEDLLKNRGY